ncbi:MAG TPA: TMEM175 family protein [Micropepsaceae bacterium]|nr:TMEM175 family protein [Micropepsaceae bacterium]
MTSQAIEKRPGTGRIETFFDGVVAILITIMVLELKLPAEVFSQGRVDAVVAEFGPKLAVYALSFVVIAIMLLNHHMLMRPATHQTNALYWWTANLLFWMSLIPLSTAALGDAPREPLAVAFYGAVLTANSVSFTLLHRCAACLGDAEGRLDEFHRLTLKKDWFFTSLYAASIPLAFVSVYLSMAIFLVNPAAYFFPEFVPWPRSWRGPQRHMPELRRKG